MNAIARVSLTLTALLSLSSVSLADPDAAPAAPQAAQLNPADKVVCRTMAPKTGSRLGARRECHMQREWDAIQQEHQKETSEMQTRGLTSSPPGH